MLKKNIGLIISLTVGLVISFFYLIGITSQLELNLGYDSSFLLKKQTKPFSKIKIIGIDQRSLDLIGEYPWRRSLYGQLIDYLGDNPRIIGFDIIMSEKSAYPKDDSFLAQVIKKRKNVILPVSLEPDATNAQKMEFVYPLEELANGAKNLGLTHYFPDNDGITRKTPLNEGFAESKDNINIFSYQIVKSYGAKNIDNLPSEIYCNFQGRENIFQVYSFYDVISKKIPASDFKDSIVLIGATAEGLQDRISSPIGPLYGVIYHAQLISNIIDNNYIKPVSKTLNVLFIFIVAFCAYFIWRYAQTANQVLLIVSSILILYILHFIAFSNNIWLGIISIIISNFITFISLILYEQLQISQSLRYELDKLINNFKNRNLHYEITNKIEISHDENKKLSNSVRVGKISDIGNILTMERTFLETLLNNIKIPIVVTDKNSFIVLTNPASEEFFYVKNESKDSNIRQEKKDLIGKRLVDITNSIPDLKADLIQVYDNKKDLPISLDYERADSVYHVRLLSLLNKAEDWNMICIIEDVTTWHKMANKDGLTSLWNQRYFKEYLQKEVSKSQRYKNDLSLIMMDVDHFKNFNDTYGHQTGDIVLKSIAKVLEENQRNTDISARYGGEEFSIILTMTDEIGAFIFADRVRKQIESLKILDINGNLVKGVTASFGISLYTTGSVSDLIESADEALYLCKDMGRNCVIKYSEKDIIKLQIEKNNIEKDNNDILSLKEKI